VWYLLLVDVVLEAVLLGLWLWWSAAAVSWKDDNYDD